VEIYKRVKSIRESKKISQDAIAFDLNLNQSQYSRREKGEIPFSAAEIEKIATILGVKIYELYGEDFLQYSLTSIHAFSESPKEISYYLIEQFQKIINEKEAIILALKEMINAFKIDSKNKNK
jgi:transcriptional regulator with XRE-family HTH domain